ncbi:cytoskeleton protein RodZ [Moorella thermoacetica]|uniref:Cytoskeleton protein RodZ n=1 Tax=Neomoorella thermoacetica TaxID=1525 RepID=A0A1J5NKK7_NEOTH|nr:cytoskeleton protein RodZ [Moorella thermoacetica]
MGQVGEILRSTRQEKGISLREAEEATKIRLKYLEALENGTYDEIPGRVYALGFLRNYARFLGLDPAELTARFKEEYPPKEAYQVEESGITTPRLTSRGWSRWLLILGIILVLWGVNRLYSYYRPSPEQPPAPPPVTQPAPATPVPVTPVQPTSPPSQAQGVEVKIRATGNCWVGAVVDGKADFSGTLKSGDEKVFQGQDKVSVTLGSAGAVEVTFNGQVQPPLGKAGSVVTFEADKGANQLRIIKKQ